MRQTWTDKSKHRTSSCSTSSTLKQKHPFSYNKLKFVLKYCKQIFMKFISLKLETRTSEMLKY